MFFFKRLICVSVFIFGLLYLGIHDLRAQGVSISPSRIFFKGSPGQTVTQTVQFSNHTNTEITFVPSIKDWNRDSIGVKHYFPAGSTIHSNAAWLSLSDFTVHLLPNESKTITVIMKIPTAESANVLSNSMLFFTQVKEQKASNTEKGLAFNIILEVGIQVYHTPSGLPKGNLAFVAFEKGKYKQENSAKAGTAIRLKIKNEGAVNKDAFVRLELTDKQTGKEIKFKPIAIAMLPKAQQWVQFPMDSNELKGSFLAVAILDEGKDTNIKVAQKELEY